MISFLDVLRHRRPGDTWRDSYRRLRQQRQARRDEAAEANRLYRHSCEIEDCAICAAHRRRFDTQPVTKHLWHTRQPDNYVQLTCGHMVKTWSTKPVRRGQVVWCHLDNSLGPAQQVEIVITHALVMWARKWSPYIGESNVSAPWPLVHVDDLVMSEHAVTIRQ